MKVGKIFISAVDYELVKTKIEISSLLQNAL